MNRQSGAGQWVRTTRVNQPNGSGWPAVVCLGEVLTDFVALDSAGSITDKLIFGPIGVSVVTASLAMLLSRLFPRWLTWLGLIGGVLLTAAGIIASSAQGAAGTWHNVGSVLGGVPVFAVWIWMIATCPNWAHRPFSWTTKGPHTVLYGT